MSVQPGLLVERGDTVRLIAANLALLDIAESGDALAEAIGALPPSSWPSENNGPEMIAWVRRLIAQHPADPGYNTWFIVGDNMLCGTAGFKGPPDAEGSVEIGYSVIPEARRRGFASGAVALLVARALRNPRVTVVRAETLPDDTASQGVLRKCGFTRTGTRIDEDDGEVICFARSSA